MRKCGDCRSKLGEEHTVHCKLYSGITLASETLEECPECLQFLNVSGHLSICSHAVPEKETVNHPPHYGGKDNPYEAIKVIEAWSLDFCLGNTLKYICRAGVKSEADIIEDLKKAQWYLNRRIEQLEKMKEEEKLK